MAKTYTVIIEHGEDGMYIANVPSIQGCYTQGRTVEEAAKRIKEAIEVCIEGEDVEESPKLAKVLQIQV